MAIPVRQMIKDAVSELGGTATYRQIIDWIKSKHGNVNEKTIRAQTIACSVNQPSRIWYPENSKARKSDPRYDFLFNTDRGEVELYVPEKHGIWEIIEQGGKTVIAKNGNHFEDTPEI